MAPQKYIHLEHTADIWIRVSGRDAVELFANAAFAFFDIVADLSSVGEAESSAVRAEAADRELLLVAWLDELLFRFETDRMIFKRFEIVELDDRHIAAKAYGQRYDRSRHRLKVEVKAVTYHQLAIRKVDDHWEASVIFDI